MHETVAQFVVQVYVLID